MLEITRNCVTPDSKKSSRGYPAGGTGKQAESLAVIVIGGGKAIKTTWFLGQPRCYLRWSTSSTSTQT
jgi:hypothetical protein